jgi:hypothetical protein
VVAGVADGLPKTIARGDAAAPPGAAPPGLTCAGLICKVTALSAASGVSVFSSTSPAPVRTRVKPSGVSPATVPETTTVRKMSMRRSGSCATVASAMATAAA